MQDSMNEHNDALAYGNKKDIIDFQRELDVLCLTEAHDRVHLRS